MTLPRLLTIMGSGETSPTMAKTHRELVASVGTPAVLLDTPFGFQANANEIVRRAQEYFRESVGVTMGVASFRSAAGTDALAAETMLVRLREAHYVFAGPGSPSYALRQWFGSSIPAVLAEKLGRGGAVTFASAAALTLGVATVPVYEIYKVGAEPAWLDGLDLLSALGLRVAVIPHYDNAEGGTHDTRYCYLGEARLAQLERELPEGVFVLGVDEHTGLVLDIDAGMATVVGRGGVTVRSLGHSVVFPAGSAVTVDDVRAAATGGGGRPRVTTPPVEAGVAGAVGASAVVSPLLESLAALEERFGAAMAALDVRGAVAAILDVDDLVVAWSRDTLQSNEMDRARGVFRSMVVRLGELAEVGARDPAAVVAPFVEALLEMRANARTAQDWQAADRVRDQLLAAGIEVKDTQEGTEWGLLS